MKENKKLTIVCPVFNEEYQIEKFIKRVCEALDGFYLNWNILFINDGSQDNTKKEINRLYENGWPVNHISLSRNFGKEAALTAGLDFADGEAVVPVDVDLQDPPELIWEMVKLWESGADVVLAQRRKRNDPKPKKFAAWVYYKVMEYLSEVELPKEVGDFRLLDKKVVCSIRLLPERNRYMKGILSWPGFKTETLLYDRPERIEGEASQSFKKLLGLALDGLFSFSSAPLRVWVLIGGVVALLSMLFMFWIVGTTLYFGRDVPGYASIMTTILFIGGIQLLSIGILGEYVARIFTEVKRRPIYIIDKEADD